MTDTVLRAISRMRRNKDRVLIAIDGRCASGKTTLANTLKEKLSCNVIHMDDFFLRPEQRTTERYDEPGGNVDRERFLEEILLPLKSESTFFYRPFDCHTMALGEPIPVHPNEIAVIEGTYSCHPALWEYYDFHIFLTTTPEKQFDRLTKRDGANVQMFREKWIPLEERYFTACKPDVKCELVLET